MRAGIVLLALVALPIGLGAQLPTAAPMAITPAVNLTICPPPPNALAICSLFTSTTSASNSGVAETDLITYSLPANTLSVNNQKVRITAWGTASATASTKTPRLYFGSTVVLTHPTTNTSASWRVSAVVARTGATAQESFGDGLSAGAGTFLNVNHTTPAETLSGAVTIKVTGQDSVGSSNLTATGMMVEWVP